MSPTGFPPSPVASWALSPGSSARFSRLQHRNETTMILPRLAGATALCAFAFAAAQATEYPLTLDNCRQTLTFEHAPEKVAAVGQSTTEMLYALGLGERVVGTSVWFNETLPEFKEIDAGVERLADNHPGFEAVVAREPELVTTQFEFHVGPQGVVGTREQFNELGVAVYAMPADCVGKDNLVGGDGARTREFSIELMYQAVRELAQIFDVEARGAELEAELRGRVEAASEKAKTLGVEGQTAVVWFSSPDLALDPFVAGRNGIAGFVLKTLGLRNIVESDEEWPSVGWEAIASADPDLIVIARMDRRRFAADDYEVKLDYLKTDPVTREMRAVKEGRIVVVDAHQIHAGIRIPSGIETIVEALEAGGAQK